MRRKRVKIAVLFLLFSWVISQKCFGKYSLQDTLNVSVYLDRTPPVIDVVNKEKTESFAQTQTEIIKKTEDFSINTSDNVEIKENEFYYHPSEANFAETEAQKFENGCEFTEDGFYEIVATDTSGNTTKIIILLDKSEPDVLVQYFKKGEVLDVIKPIAGIRKYMTTENMVNMTEEETEEEIPVENTKESEEQEEIPETEEVIEKEENEAEEEKETKTETETEEKQEEPISNIVETEEKKEEQNEIEEESMDEEKEIMDTEEIEVNFVAEDEIMLMAGDSYVGNEAEFRNALAMKSSIIHVRQSIDFYNPIYINYAVTIVSEGTSNSLRYRGGGDFIIVENGGSLTIDAMVIDTNSSGISGINVINIRGGGQVTFINGSIVDGGLGNTGILINGNASLLLWSCEIVRCNLGINLQMNGNLWFATQEGRSNNFYWNKTAVYIDNFYGNCALNQNISMHDNSEYGVYIANSSGTINISAGNYYQNTCGIHARNVIGGSVTVSGGSYYSNNWAIWAGGNLNLTGGNIYSNYYGIFADAAYSGSFKMTGGNIYSNTSYAIYHTKTNDGGCTITGGSVSGEIYLAGNDNYINTNSSYPKLTVTPSSYYMKRKLVKATNNNVANSEISKVTVTPKDAWYKYVDNEYIVLWNGGNVIVRCKDYNGNILKQETMNGTIGASYSVVAPKIAGYDLIKTPANAKGKYTQSDIIVDLQYDVVNVARVTFSDLLSGVISAKYWYNASSQNFSGAGTDFTDGTVFENYGYYKVIVMNGVGLQRGLIFTLNKDSLVR